MYTVTYKIGTETRTLPVYATSAKMAKQMFKQMNMYDFIISVI